MESPFWGVEWMWIGMLDVAALLVLVPLLALLNWRFRVHHAWSRRLYAASLAAAAWAFFTLGEPVTVPDPGGGEPGECVGWYESFGVADVCGRAYLRNLARSLGPALVMTFAVLAALTLTVRARLQRTPRGVQPSRVGPAASGHGG